MAKTLQDIRNQMKRLVESVLVENDSESIKRSPELITKLEEINQLRPVIWKMETAWEESNNGPNWMATDTELEEYLNGSIDINILCDYVASGTIGLSKNEYNDPEVDHPRDPFEPNWFDKVKFEQAVQEIVKKALSGSKNSDVNKEDVKNELLDAFDLNDTIILGGLSEEKVAEAGKILFPNKPNGPFTFVFEFEVKFGNDTKYKTEEYTADNNNFVDACKKAFAWKKRQLYLYDSYEAASFIAIR